MKTGAKVRNDATDMFPDSGSERPADWAYINTSTLAG